MYAAAGWVAASGGAGAAVAWIAFAKVLVAHVVGLLRVWHVLSLAAFSRAMNAQSRPCPPSLNHQIFDRVAKGIREAPSKALMGELAAAGGDSPAAAFGLRQVGRW